MKEQLEVLAKEMITEIKNIKDLAKEELPLVAKEYVEYNIKTSFIGAIITGVVSLLSIAMLIGVLIVYLKSGTFYEVLFPISLVGTIGLIIGGISCCVNVSQYLEFKLQPRRKAIEAITSLF